MKTAIFYSLIIAFVCIFLSCELSSQANQIHNNHFTNVFMITCIYELSQSSNGEQENSSKTENEENKERKNKLTEEEIKDFSDWRDKAFRNEKSLRRIPEKEAIKYYNMLIRDYGELTWYIDHLAETGTIYQDDVCDLITNLAFKKSEEGYRVTLEIFKDKNRWRNDLMCALRAIKFYNKKEAIPVIRECLTFIPSRDMFKDMPEKEIQKLLNIYKNEYRLEAAGSLLALGDTDIALQTLDQLSKEGSTTALGYIFHNHEGAAWQKKGIELIKKAFTYKNNETKALAGLFLIRLTKSGIIKADLNEIKRELFIMTEEIVQKRDWTRPSRGYNDGRAIETLIIAFKELNAKDSIPLLQRIRDHHDASYLSNRANDAIKDLR